MIWNLIQNKTKCIIFWTPKIQQTNREILTNIR